MAMAAKLRPALKPGYAVFSGASGIAAPTAAEAGFLADLRDAGPVQGPVRQTADLLGHSVEAAFPANLALAALAIEAGTAPQALVTGFGMWRGEALAVVEPIAEGAAE
jgi:3-oxoacyl-[acyl-carrier-protein] synthase II